MKHVLVPFVAVACALPAFAAVARAQGTDPSLQPLPPPSATSTGTASPADFGLPPAAPAPAPAPAPASAPAAAPAPDDDEVKGRAFRPSFKGALGFEYAHVHGVPIEAGRLRLGVGGQNDVMAHYAMLSIMVGETEAGRRAWDVRIGWSGDARIATILRLGLDVELGYLFVRRATIDERMYALGIGAGAHVGVDALTWGPRDDHALTIEGRIEGHIHFGNAALWGPSILLGLRF